MDKFHVRHGSTMARQVVSLLVLLSLSSIFAPVTLAGILPQVRGDYGPGYMPRAKWAKTPSSWTRMKHKLAMVFRSEETDDLEGNQVPNGESFAAKERPGDLTR